MSAGAAEEKQFHAAACGVDVRAALILVPHGIAEGTAVVRGTWDESQFTLA
jgi:hypothetical protein